ncbi:HAD family hydrolase [Tepidicaulis marinus]|nr:HAD family hydrolase [Tepidicaulis marinus]
MPKKIVVLDLEGTLIKVPRLFDTDVPKSMWQTIAQLLGPECLREEERSHARWLSGDIPDYVTWMDQTVRMLLRYGLNKNDIETLVSNIEIVCGAQRFAQRIHSQGGVLAIVTGALKAIAEPVQIALGAQHLFAGCELYFDQRGEVVHWNLLPSDWYGKVDFMYLLAREYQADLSEVVFIGDGVNDVELAKQAGLSIGFNPDSGLARVVDIIVEQPDEEQDFEAVAGIIENFWRAGKENGDAVR